MKKNTSQLLRKAWVIMFAFMNLHQNKVDCKKMRINFLK